MAKDETKTTPSAFPTLGARTLALTGIDPDKSLRQWLARLLHTHPRSRRMDRLIADGNARPLVLMDIFDPRYLAVLREKGQAHLYRGPRP